jgi:hypothetical protein
MLTDSDLDKSNCDSNGSDSVVSRDKGTNCLFNIHMLNSNSPRAGHFGD